MDGKRTRAQLLRDEIIEATAKLVAEHGMDFPMRILADNLNTWPNAIYGHFPSKLHLQEAAANYIIDDVFCSDAVSEIIARKEPWQDKFRTLARLLFDCARAHPGLGRLQTYYGVGGSSGSFNLVGTLVSLGMEQGLPERRAAILVQSAIVYIVTLGDMAAHYDSDEADMTAVEGLTAEDLADNVIISVFYDRDKQQQFLDGLEVFITAAEAEIRAI